MAIAVRPASITSSEGPLPGAVDRSISVLFYAITLRRRRGIDRAFDATSQPGKGRICDRTEDRCNPEHGLKNKGEDASAIALPSVSLPRTIENDKLWRSNSGLTRIRSRRPGRCSWC
jgi:hypothetical protein